MKLCIDFEVECCVICHEDYDQGYRLPKAQLKSGEVANVCCYIMEWLLDEGLIDA